MAEIELEILFRNSEKNRGGGGVCYVEFNEPEPSASEEKPSTPEENTIEPKPVSST